MIIPRQLRKGECSCFAFEDFSMMNLIDALSNSEYDCDRKKIMSVVQGNQKSADRFAFWKRLKELEKSISTQLQPVYKSNNGQHWNPNLICSCDLLLIHITVETVFREHPQDQGKCFLNGSWAEVS